MRLSARRMAGHAYRKAQGPLLRRETLHMFAGAYAYGYLEVPHSGGIGLSATPAGKHFSFGHPAPP